MIEPLSLKTLTLDNPDMPGDPTHDPRADDVPERRRFTIAHELGHWICQYREGGLALFYCRPGDVAAAADRAAEREANVFAAELLMPEPAVRAAWGEGPEIAACAERFSVSGEAMHWRLYNLGLVEERPA